MERWRMRKGNTSFEVLISSVISLHRIEISWVSLEEETITRAGVRLAKNQMATIAAISVLPVLLAA
jgi:hypothetical protein